MLELQELLVRLPDEWLSVRNKIDRVDEAGGADPADAYRATVDAAKPWQRAHMLSSRIVDNRLRRIVDDATDLAYPYDDVDLPSLFVGLATATLPDYPYRGAELQVRSAVRSLGDELRQPIANPPPAWLAGLASVTPEIRSGSTASDLIAKQIPSPEPVGCQGSGRNRAASTGVRERRWLHRERCRHASSRAPPASHGKTGRIGVNDG